MKQKTKNFQGREDDASLGDAYCFIGIERNTKLILAWHLGQRTRPDTAAFVEKIAHATNQHKNRTLPTRVAFLPYDGRRPPSEDGK